MNEEEKIEKNMEDQDQNKDSVEPADTEKQPEPDTGASDAADTVPDSGKDAEPIEAAAEKQEPEWAAEMDTYPLREKGEDPKWAIRTVWTWLGFDLFCIAGILLLLILGAIYD